MDSIYPAVPVYLALGLTVAITGIANALLISKTTSIAVPKYLLFLVTLSLLGSAGQLLFELFSMMNLEQQSDNSIAQQWHFANISIAIIAAGILFGHAINNHLSSTELIFSKSR